MTPLYTLGWEFVQNLPLVAGFLIALRLWGNGAYAAAIGCALAGAAGGALIIRATEARIVAGHSEPLRVVAANVLAMTGLAVAALAYLTASWSNWQTDLPAGALAGTLLAAVQSLASREPLSLGHCAAFACAFPPALIGVRLIDAILPLGVNILVITTALTLTIAAIDYRPTKRQATE